MEATDVLRLRVILDDVNAERLILPSRPETVNALIIEIKNKLNLAYDFWLQFQDPEFDNALCNLVNIEDLSSKATIKIVRYLEPDLSSTSTDDTLLSDNRFTRSSLPMARDLCYSNILLRGGACSKRGQLCICQRGENSKLD